MKLTVTDISKTYPGGVKALKNVNLDISEGMFGLLGPNGAGKSTLMRTLATLQSPDSGTAELDGLDITTERMAIRKRLGYLPQDFGVYPDSTAEQLLSYIAVLKGITKKNERKEIVKYFLDQTNLFEFRKRKLGSFSGGMRQRFGIAQALIGDPDLIIVDEPTAGLDPEERNRFYNILSEIAEGRIVILSSHIVEDIRVLCDRIAIINRGEVLFTGSPGEAIKNLEGKIWEKTVDKEDIDDYRENYTVILNRLSGGKMKIHVQGNSDPADGFRNVNPDIEDVYFSFIRGISDTSGKARPA